MADKCPNYNTCANALYAQGALEDAAGQGIELSADNQQRLEARVEAAQSIGACAINNCPMGIAQAQ